MPTLLLLNGFRFFFYSNENNEPIHVHIEKGDAIGKVWLEPTVKVVYMQGFNSKEIGFILETIETNFEVFKLKWNEHFRK